MNDLTFLKLLSLTLITTLTRSQSNWCNITTTSQYAGSTTSHSFICTFQNYTIPTTNTYFYVNYSSSWNLASITKSNANDFCETGCTLGSVTTSSLSNNIRVNGLIPNALTNAYVSFRYTLNNIKNPTFSTVQTININFFTSGGASISTHPIQINVYPSKMSCSVSISNLALSATAIYTFTVTPSITVPSNGFMKMIFPSIWTNSIVGPTLSFTSCTSASCSLTNNTINATNLVASNTTSPFTFSINSVVNPQTEQPNTDLRFQYYYANASQISTCQVNISGLTSPALVAASFHIVNNVGQLNFTNVLLPLSTDEVLLTLPSQVYIGDFLKAAAFIGTSTSQKTLNPKIIGTNQISLQPYTSSNITDIDITLTNLYLQYPAQTNSAAFSLRRGNYQYSYANCCNLTLSSNQSLTIQVTLTNYFLQAPSQYIIIFSPTYYGINYFVVNFGSAFSFTVSTTYSCYISTLTISSQMICTAISTYQIKATLTNTSALFTSYLGYASNYSLVIIGLTNPSQVINTVQLSTYYLPSTQLEYSNSYTVSYTTTLIIGAYISCSSYIVGATADYTFSINNTNSLLPDSIINIYFPYSYTLDNTTNTCTINSSTTPCNVVNSTYLQFSLPSIIIPSYTLSFSTLTVLNLVNPNSIEPTPSFGIALQSGGAVVEALSDGLVVAMTTLARFSNLTVAPSTLVAGSLASYTIAFNHSLTLRSSSKVTLKFSLPASMTFVSCSACTSYQTFTIVNTTSSVVISNVYNPQKVTETSNIIVSLYVDNYLSIQDTVAPPVYTALNTSWTVRTNSSYLGEPIAANFTIANIPLNTQFFIITVPIQYTVGVVTAYAQGSFNFTYAKTGNSINFTVNLISSSNVTFIIQGLSNPVNLTNSTWQINIYAPSSILISLEATLFSFNAVCGTTCRSCENSTYCLSCYSNPSVNNLPYLNSASNLCVSSCLAQGEFLQASVCYPCNSSCLSCSLFSNNCTSCNNGSFLYLNLCISQCPDTYYGANNTCYTCSNNCMTCSSSVICLTCASNYVLQNTSACQLACSSGYYNNSNVCTVCPTNCLTCNPNGCLTCNGSNYLTTFTYASCVSNCSTGTYISANNLTCESCQTPCLTCSVYSNSCTSCLSSSTNKFFSNFTCLGICPNQTYADQLNQCQACQSPCQNCNNLNNCTSCISSYLFYEASNECLVACFSNTINVSNICVKCTSPCLTCQLSVTNCTSCIENYFFLNNSCTPNCSFPYIITGSICSLCYSPCATCVASNITNCLSCISGYFLFSTKCYQTCPSKTYQNSVNTCAACSAPCYECSSTSISCTSCYNGSFLVNSSCYFPCPPNYYQNNSICELCQSQCLSCTHTTSYQCSACSSLVYYFNPITYECTSNCSIPYYVKSGQMICEVCQLPCKTCVAISTDCASCYGGYFLLNKACNTTCGNGYYGDSIGNICIQCISPCATCDNQKCFTCQANSYFYQGMCYNSCPLQAPNVYGLYCRNCLLANCINCNSDGLCTMCLPTYYSFNGDCLSSCPANYQPDLASNSQCILSSQVAYLRFIKKLQTQKIWLVPSTSSLFISLPFLYLSQVKLFYTAFALGIPQVLSLVEMTAIYIKNWQYLTKPLLPQWLMYALIGSQLISSIIYTLVVKYYIQKEQSFTRWVEYGSNRFRYTIVVVSSLFNKQFIFLIFSGLLNLPFTSYKFTFFTPLYFAHILFMFLQATIFALGMLIVYYENTLQYNYKLFYSGIDLLIVYGFTIVFNIIFLGLVKNQPSPSQYQKYILPNVSNKTLPPYSQINEDAIQSTPNNLHRSNSDQDIFESQQMKDVQFRSAFDPDEYLDETPNMDFDKVEQGIENGVFRKKNKKKRGHRRQGKFNLDIIEQEEQDQKQQRQDNKKKKKKSKEENDGGLKNYMYWKKPKEKKNNPIIAFKQNQTAIMSCIKQKESEFDSITQNDIIFQDYNEDDSSDDNYNIQEESRRALHKPTYDNYFNLNYASKKHLDQFQQSDD